MQSMDVKKSKSNRERERERERERSRECVLDEKRREVIV
jgi:hypothetical protein